jgi:hypothetical protein
MMTAWAAAVSRVIPLLQEQQQEQQQCSATAPSDSNRAVLKAAAFLQSLWDTAADLYMGVVSYK